MQLSRQVREDYNQKFYFYDSSAMFVPIFLVRVTARPSALTSPRISVSCELSYLKRQRYFNYSEVLCQRQTRYTKPSARCTGAIMLSTANRWEITILWFVPMAGQEWQAGDLNSRQLLPQTTLRRGHHSLASWWLLLVKALSVRPLTSICMLKGWA